MSASMHLSRLQPILQPVASGIWKHLPRDQRRWLVQSVSNRLSRMVPGQTDASEINETTTRVIVGPASTSYSLGHTTRLIHQVLEQAYPVKVFDVASYLPDVSKGEDRFISTEPDDGPSVSEQDIKHLIFAVSGHLIAYAGLFVPNSLRANSFVSGYLTWEFPQMPKTWLKGLDRLDHVVVPSNFVRDSIRHVRPDLPCVVAPHPIDRYVPVQADFASMMNDPLVVLHSCNLASGHLRKNPLGVARAFARAFEPGTFGETGVGPKLRMILNNAALAPDIVAEIRDLFRNRDDLTLTCDTLSRADYNEWWKGGHVFASLHRSEGFGLGLAEAMAAGYATLGTAYSGNMTYMNDSNSSLVKFKSVATPEAESPDNGTLFTWAEPDLDHAVDLLRSCHEDRERLVRIAKTGQKQVLKTCAAQHTIDAFDINR